MAFSPKGLQPTAAAVWFCVLLQVSRRVPAVDDPMYVIRRQICAIICPACGLMPSQLVSLSSLRVCAVGGFWMSAAVTHSNIRDPLV